MSQKKTFIYRKVKVFEIEFQAWNKAHAQEMLEDGYLIYHDHEMECKTDEEKIVQKRGA